MINTTFELLKKIAAAVLIAVCVLTGLTSCAGTAGKKMVDVFIHREQKNLKNSSILVFNFHDPAYAEGMGGYVAERFHVNLLESKKFKVVGLNIASPWNRIAETEEGRLLNAIEEGCAKEYDYIMVGELKAFFYGGINATRVTIKVRIIETSTRTTVFLAESSARREAKDPSFPMDTQMAKTAEHPKSAAETMVKEIVKRI